MTLRCQVPRWIDLSSQDTCVSLKTRYTFLALKERRNYNIHETNTGRIRASGMHCDCVPSQRKDVRA